MIKRSCIFAAVILAGLTAACGLGAQNRDAAEPSPAPASPTAATTKDIDYGALKHADFSLWSWYGGSKAWNAVDYNAIRCFQVLSQRTNTTLEWRMQSDTDTFDSMMASDNLPDAVYYAWSAERQSQYAASGSIVDIYPYIQRYAPHIDALINSVPQIKKQLVTDDGKIYFAPWITAAPELVNNEGFAIRRDWLYKFGLSVPVTTDEFYNAISVFHTQDANSNGLQDEYISGYPSQVYRLSYAFGTADGMCLDDDRKTMVYGPATEKYRDFLKYMNKLYAANLLDPDIFSQDSGTYMKKLTDNRVSAFCDTAEFFDESVKAAAERGLTIDWAPMPYLQYNGKSANLNSASKRYVQPYGLAVTAACDDVERMVEFLDYFYTDEGNRLMNWGVEGESYTDDGGELQYTDAVMQNPDLDPVEAMSRYADPTFVGVQDPAQAAALLSDLGRDLKAAWSQSDDTMAAEPFLWYTDEEQKINLMRADLDASRDQWRDKFVTGRRDVYADAVWYTYLDELKGLGLDEVVKAQQAAAERYAAK